MPRPHRPPAPEGFWENVKGYHATLWRDAAQGERRRLLYTCATDQWDYGQQEGFTDPLTIAQWKGYRLVGGIATAGKLAITKPIASTAEGQYNEDDSRMPITYTAYTYLMPKPPAIAPFLIVNRMMFDGTEADNGADQLHRRIRAGIIEYRKGLITPEADDYAHCLSELAIGASGEYRRWINGE